MAPGAGSTCALCLTPGVVTTRVCAPSSRQAAARPLGATVPAPSAPRFKAQASQLPHAAGAGEANRVLVLFFVSGDRNRIREIPGCPLCHPPNSQATHGPALVFT